MRDRNQGWRHDKAILLLPYFFALYNMGLSQNECFAFGFHLKQLEQGTLKKAQTQIYWTSANSSISSTFQGLGFLGP